MSINNKIILFSLLLALSSLGHTTEKADKQLIAEGKMIANRGNEEGALACSKCHGLSDTEHTPAGYARINGLSLTYLEKQVKDFNKGTRQSDVMHMNAMALVNSEEMHAVLSFYSSLKKVEVASEVEAADYNNQADVLAKNGDWSKGIPACNQCHGPNGYGVGDIFPTIAEQDSQYIQEQLKAFKLGNRYNDPQDLMSNVATRLDDKQIREIAEYFSSFAKKTPKNSHNKKGGKK